MTTLYPRVTILYLIIDRIKVMKELILAITLPLLLTTCSENPVNSSDENNEWSLQQESANFPWESISGNVVYQRRVGYHKQSIILVDGERRVMKILKTIPYLHMITWHYTGTKITGADLGELSILSEGRSPSFFCFDLNGNSSTTNYSPAAVHSWSNDGKVASLSGSFSKSVYINQQLFLSSSDYSFSPTRPTWSADNNYLVTSIIGVDHLGIQAELKKFDINTMIGITLVVADSVGYNFSFENPIYSPDGLKILFQRNTIDNLGESEGIFLINLDGAGLHKILSQGSDMPIWK
jgi:hypothetical protein